MSKHQEESYPGEFEVVGRTQWALPPPRKLRMWLKHLRLLCGWTQQDLGDKVNRSRTAIYNIERGVSDPSYGTVMEIVGVLKARRLAIGKRGHNERRRLRRRFYKQDKEDRWNDDIRQR